MNGDNKPERTSVFATGFHQPFGIQFYPPGKNPQYVYVANTNSVVRYAYHNGELEAKGAAETVIADIPGGGGHWTKKTWHFRRTERNCLSPSVRGPMWTTPTHPAETHRANILEYAGWQIRESIRLRNSKSGGYRRST